jgi:CheY-like chemotaxis protein
MGKIISIILIVLSTICANLGISFFHNQKNTDRIRFYVTLFNLFASLWCFTYGCMGFCKQVDTAFHLRLVGLIGVLGLFFVDALSVAYLSHLPKIIERTILAVVGVLTVMDYFIFGQEGVDFFILHDGWMTWTTKSSPQRTFHSMYVLLLLALFLAFSVRMYVKASSHRQRRYILSFLAANLLMFLGSLPDTYYLSAQTVAYPTSGIGAASASIVLWYGALKLNAFNVSLENLSNVIYQSVDVGILVFDPYEHKLLMCNPKSSPRLPQSPQGKHFSELFPSVPVKEEDYFKKAMSKDGSFLKFETADGMTYSIHTTAAYDNFNEPYCFVCAVYDLTSEANTQKELIKASNAKSDFLSHMSHEIRTPINSILGMNQLILRESKDPTITGYASDISSSSRMLLSLVNDILDFSKIESGKMQLFPITYDVSSLIHDLCTMVAPRAAEKDLEFHVNINPALPSQLIGDDTRIRQIGLNLLTNAVKYTAKGSVTVHFDYRSDEKEQFYLVLSVQDTGQGIREEDQPLLLSSFTRINEKANRSIEGSGLGLSITSRLLDLMHGELKLKSTFGEGSTFTVSIPQAVADRLPVGDLASRIAASSSSFDDIETHIYAPHGKVLVVDDVAMNCRVFTGLLKETGLDIDTAGSGKEALELCKKKSYHMIFMDHMMPEMDGIETFHRIKSDCPLNADIPIVILTANAVAGMREEYLAQGFSGYLSKPVTGKELEEMIAKFLPKEAYEPSETIEDSDESEEVKGLSEDPVEQLKHDFPQLDIDSALPYCMGDASFFREILKEYINGDHSLILSKAFEEKDLDTYRINVHAIKSTSKTIGALEVSKDALALEQAAKNGDRDFIQKHHYELLHKYTQLLSSLSA